MFVRTKIVHSKGHSYEYLQIVEAFRQDGKVRQKVVANLGRLDELRASGELDRITAALARFSEANAAFLAFQEGRFDHCVTRCWGPALVFGRLWERQGLPHVLRSLAAGRKFAFDPERVAFALALQRLCEPGSDLQGSEWLKDVEGLPEIGLHQMYRAVGWLAEVREELERTLFHRDRDLFHQEIDLVFLDTTSTYVYRDQETAFCKRGYSRDKRPDLPQMVLCVAVDRYGWPIAWEVFPGNTADKDAFSHVVTRLRERFQIRRVVVVADRGMISKDSIELLTGDKEAPFDFILGCRMRRDLDVTDLLHMTREFDEIAPGLGVAERTLDGKRYVVCYNEVEAKKDAAAREAMVQSLMEKLEAGESKSLVGNTGYRRFLKGEKGSWRIDFQKAKDDALYDGVFVLRTNTDLPAAEVVKTYKGLWRVERTFREQKSTLELRPLFHHNDDTRIGHIVASFLALRLEVDLQRRLDERGAKTPWLDLMRDLKRVQAIHLELDGREYRLRTDLVGAAHQAFAAAGLRPPPAVNPLPTTEM
ncbi:IS1634 family transposase [bacterium]|nr:IS1634 family transposase [bacterium]